MNRSHPVIVNDRHRRCRTVFGSTGHGHLAHFEVSGLDMGSCDCTHHGGRPGPILDFVVWVECMEKPRLGLVALFIEPGLPQNLNDGIDQADSTLDQFLIQR